MSSLGLVVDLRIEEVCTRFENAWQTDGQPRIEDFLDGWHGAELAALLPELVLLDIDYRRQAGQRPDPLDYLARFPELDRAFTRRDTARFAFLDATTSPDAFGQFTARYRVLRQLGQGGMGLVFLADDRSLRRQVALKVMREPWASQPSARARFLDEARAMARHHHARIVTVHDFGEANGVPYLTMPLLEGEALDARLARNPPVSLGECLRIAREAAEGLAIAHRAGQIHRDIKPGNLWLTAPNAEVVLLDFGLAHHAERDGSALTAMGDVLGTAQYMSPEQANGALIDERSDLFSLGVVLYQMLTGQRPFAAHSLTAVLLQVVSHTPPSPSEVRPSVPVEISAFTMRLLAKAPADRPASAAAVVETLRQLEAGPDPVTVPMARPAVAVTLLKGRPGLLAGVVAVLLALLAGGLYAVLPSGPAVPKYAEPPVPKPDPTKPRGYVDVLLCQRAGEPFGLAVPLPLSNYTALPMRNGACFRIEAHSDVPAYLYLLWWTSEGNLEPAYPWQPGKWGTRPEHEELRTALELPVTKGNGYKFNGPGSGMETLILLARTTPLTATDAEIECWFEGVKPQQALADNRSAVWFVDGVIVEDGPRKRQHFEEVPINRPTLHLQTLLQEKLSSQASFTAAVSFAKLAR